MKSAALPRPKQLPLRQDASGRLDGSAIRHLEFFARLDDSACGEIARESQIAHIRKGGALFAQGEMPRRLFLILNGRSKATRVMSEGSRIVVRFLGPGDLAGYVGIFDDRAYTTTALAVTDIIALCWSRQAFFALMARYPALAVAVIRGIGRFLEEADARLGEAATQRVERRIAHAILRLVRQAGRRVDGGIEISFPITRRDIALMAGTNLYTVSRMLSGWEQRGVVDGGRQHLVLRDPHALVRIAEEE